MKASRCLFCSHQLRSEIKRTHATHLSHPPCLFHKWGFVRFRVSSNHLDMSGEAVTRNNRLLTDPWHFQMQIIFWGQFSDHLYSTSEARTVHVFMRRGVHWMHVMQRGSLRKRDRFEMRAWITTERRFGMLFSQRDRLKANVSVVTRGEKRKIIELNITKVQPESILRVDVCWRGRWILWRPWWTARGIRRDSLCDVQQADVHAHLLMKDLHCKSIRI